MPLYSKVGSLKLLLLGETCITHQTDSIFTFLAEGKYSLLLDAFGYTLMKRGTLVASGHHILVVVTLQLVLSPRPCKCATTCVTLILSSSTISPDQYMQMLTAESLLVHLQFRLLTLVSHHGQWPLLYHHTHDLVQGISSRHRGVLGVGVVRGLNRSFSSIHLGMV